MKTSRRFASDVNEFGPNEAFDKLMHYFVSHYGLFATIRHIRQIDAATDAVISKTETTGD